MSTMFSRYQNPLGSELMLFENSEISHSQVFRFPPSNPCAVVRGHCASNWRNIKRVLCEIPNEIPLNLMSIPRHYRGVSSWTTAHFEQGGEGAAFGRSKQGGKCVLKENSTLSKRGERPSAAQNRGGYNTAHIYH